MLYDNLYFLDEGKTDSLNWIISQNIFPKIIVQEHSLKEEYQIRALLPKSLLDVKLIHVLIILKNYFISSAFILEKTEILYIKFISKSWCLATI